MNYLKDGNIFLVRAKGIVEGHWEWRNPRLGLPFGANWLDFPLNTPIDSAIMWCLARFTSSAPLIVNIDWMLELAATAAAAAFALLWLGFRTGLAVCGAVIFALQPYQWIGPHNLHCLPGPMPLIAAFAIGMVQGKKIPKAACVLACVWAGLAYPYISFFCCLVLGLAGVLGWIGRRELRPLLVATGLIIGIVLVTVANLAPSLLYRFRNGPNAAMLFKSPVEGEIYALRFRYLLTPSPDHPLAFVRDMERRMAGVKFPVIENEDEFARLGTLGSVGLLCLIAVALGSLVGAGFAQRASKTLLGPCAALTLLCILFATVGGFNVFFDTFVTPEIRAWARIFPFIGFFCVAAVCELFSPLILKLRSAYRVAALSFVVILAVLDQAMPSYAYNHMDGVYRNDDAFVKRIESSMPAGAAIYELPYADFPNDSHPGKLLVNDMLRPYLHSSQSGWSAGAVSGTTSAEWDRMAAEQPVPQMLNALVHRGFTGLWLDRQGYEASPEIQITQETGTQPMVDSQKRFLFWDLRNYAERVRSSESTMGPVMLRERNPVQALFERGFYFPEPSAGEINRWSLRRGRIELVNPLPVPRDVDVSMYVWTAEPGGTISIGSQKIRAPGTFRGHVQVPPMGSVKLGIECNCNGVRTPSRTIYFGVGQFTSSG